MLNILAFATITIKYFTACPTAGLDATYQPTAGMDQPLLLRPLVGLFPTNLLVIESLAVLKKKIIKNKFNITKM